MALPRPVTRSLVTVGALTGLGAAFLAGTSFGGPQSDPGRPGPGSDASPVAAYAGSDLSLAESCDDLLEWYVDQGADLVGPWGWGGYGYPVSAIGGDVMMLESDGAASSDLRNSAPAPAAGPAPVRSTSEETGTNVQEAGVDEPDVVKTDGTTLFRIEDGDLVTYDLSGTEVEQLASVDLAGSSRDSQELLLSGDTVVVVTTDDADTDRATTEVETFDVSDPAAPELTHTAAYDAGLVTARLHNGVVRLVLTAGLPDLDFVEPDRSTTDYEATRHNEDVVRDSEIADWLPTVSYDDGPAESLLDCEQVAIPDEESALGTIAVVGFDAPAPDAPSVSGLAVDTDLAYASTDQLYLATSPWFRGDVINCMNCLEPMPAPEGGLTEILPRWLPRPQSDFGPGTGDGASHLYAFDLSGIDTVFAASGEVDGVVRDRWSMDAVDGTLRIAVGPNVATDNANSMVTFRQDGNDLVEAGRLDGLGVGEDIKSVRWFDTLAIVVTFRQVDPLYAVDLTDAADPELMGELKIPGFSAYLHPLGEQRLLGVGEGPGPNGQWGAQAALFDVTDLTDPRQLDVESFGPGTTAMATLDPRQLTWLPDGRTVLHVVADAYGGGPGYVSVLTLGDGELDNRMVEVEYGAEVADVRLVPLADGRVVLVTGDDATFFDTSVG